MSGLSEFYAKGENMKNKSLWNSKCGDDYKGRHFWQKLGVVNLPQTIGLVWRCSQCQKCIVEELEVLVSGVKT